MFLTDEQLIELTGYKRRKDQIRCLREHGIFPIVTRLGIPRVTLGMLESAKPRKQEIVEPDFSRLNE